MLISASNKFKSPQAALRVVNSLTSLRKISQGNDVGERNQKHIVAPLPGGNATGKIARTGPPSWTVDYPAPSKCKNLFCSSHRVAPVRLRFNQAASAGSEQST